MNAKITPSSTLARESLITSATIGDVVASGWLNAKVAHQENPNNAVKYALTIKV